jgi:hypothetical protein
MILKMWIMIIWIVTRFSYLKCLSIQLLFNEYKKKMYMSLCSKRNLSPINEHQLQ